MENLFAKMEIFMKVNGLMEIYKEKEFLFKKMETNMKVNGLIIIEKV